MSWVPYCTWKISSLCDSKECSFSFRFLKSHRATVWKQDIDKKIDWLYLNTRSNSTLYNKTSLPKHHSVCEKDAVKRNVMSHLVCRARGKNELAVRVKWQTVDLRCVGVDCMAGFGGVVWSSVPADEQNDIPLTLHRRKFSDEPFCLCAVFLVIRKLFTSWASGHLQRIQRGTREASARKRLLPQQCDRWRSSSHPRLCPPLAQRWCPTDRLSLSEKIT